MIAEQEVLYGSKPSPSKPQSVKKASRPSSASGATKRVSLGGAMVQTPTKATQSCSTRKTDKVQQSEQLNYLDDGTSCLSSGSLFRLYSFLPLLFLADFLLGKSIVIVFLLFGWEERTG